jgi:hypothetical protein
MPWWIFLDHAMYLVQHIDIAEIIQHLHILRYSTVSRNIYGRYFFVKCCYHQKVTW